MILDSVKHWDANRNQYGDVIRNAIDFTLGLNVDRMDGRIDIVDQKMFVFRAEGKTEVWGNRLGECHAKHADIHIILEGAEGFGYAPASEEHHQVEDMLVEKDYALFDEIANEQRFILESGMFTVFWPGEVHRSGCSHTGEGNYVKLVVKIHESLFIPSEGMDA
ncbi:hypothetical protein A8709_32630 [Paenibacillus pectinilyticus]|uniref:YhcH/YjgK/YiaL family protein n=1 Tax=Paenibacillus pectinilyticus TaxID=512399 RepID=A0A1C0ZWS1_9BACL|nr:YhcH/YjgK/YiaL family protein [Paenibacillus pectinilyticus]OCT12564.1 hypothetical protein A8709_32630 [Paenibacillus pectinilyticus]